MEQAFWKSRYEQAQTGWDLGDISSPIKAYVDQLTNKELKILIPGCGFGYEAIYLHTLGFKHVYVLDFVPEALEKLLLNCPTFPKNRLLNADFFMHEGSYDLLIEQTFFCAIHPEKRSDYAKQVAHLLRKGGKLVGLLFDRSFESGPPFGGSVEEYHKVFEPYFETISMNPCYNSIPPRAGSEVFIQFIK